MGTRLGLQSLLENVLGSRNVYFQPPGSLALNYPAIVYSVDDIDNSFADNSVYKQKKGYLLTVIDKNPDSSIVDRVSMLPSCRFDRAFVSDNLNHTIFKIYY